MLASCIEDEGPMAPVSKGVDSLELKEPDAATVGAAPLPVAAAPGAAPELLLLLLPVGVEALEPLREEEPTAEEEEPLSDEEPTAAPVPITVAIMAAGPGGRLGSGGADPADPRCGSSTTIINGESLVPK